MRHYGMPTIFNYGCIPQTWEDPEKGGDGDPIDLVDLGQFPKPIMAVSDYVVLGCIGLIDQGEIDWKVLGLEVNEAEALQINKLEDYEKVNPGNVDKIVEWFRTYKTLEGKGLNEFREDGKIYDRLETLRIIFECSKEYREMMAHRKLAE